MTDEVCWRDPPALLPLGLEPGGFLRISAVEAMGCVAEPVGRSKSGHCFFSSVANAAGAT